MVENSSLPQLIRWATLAFRPGWPSRGRRPGRAFQPRLEVLEFRAVPAQIVWDGAGMDLNWNNRLNWLEPGSNPPVRRVPGTNDDAVISIRGITVHRNGGGTVRIHSLQSEAALLITGIGSLVLDVPSVVNGPLTLACESTVTISCGFNGVGDLTVGGLITWTSGYLGGTGRTHANGGVVMAPGDPRLGGPRLGAGHTFENVGMAMLSTQFLGGGNPTPSRWVNLPGSVLEFQGNSSFSASEFTNAGTVRKSGAPATTGRLAASTSFTNTGTIQVQGGTLTLNSPNNLTVGSTVTVAAGATLAVESRATVFPAGASVTGAGNLHFDPYGSMCAATVAGTYALTGQTRVESCAVSFNTNVSIGALTLVGRGGGYPIPVLSGSGTVTVNGLLTWTDGRMQGPGRTIAAGGMALPGNNARYLDGRTLDNTSAAVSDGRVYFLLQNGAVWNNLLGSLLDFRGDGQIHVAAPYTSAFVNAGTLRKSGGTGTVWLNLATSFVNTGTVDVQTGTLDLSYTDRLDGMYTVGASGTLLLGSSRTGELLSSSRVTGAGNVTFRAIGVGGTVTTVAGLYAITGTTRIEYGHTVTFSRAASTGELVQSGGGLGGAGDFSVVGLLTWTAGSMSGSGRTVANGGIVFGASGNFVLNGRTLDNAGTALMAGTGAFTMSNGAVWNNLPGSSLELLNARTISQGTGTAAFLNAGTVRKAKDAGTFTVGVPFTNSGTVEVLTGTLNLSRGLTNFANNTLTDGRYVLGGELRLPNADVYTNAADLVLDGPAGGIRNQSGRDALANLTVNSEAGQLSLYNGRELSLPTFTNAGTVTVAGSLLGVAGDYTQSAGRTTLSDGNLFAQVVDLQGGSLDGSGYLAGNVRNAARIEVGGTGAAGFLYLLGDYTQTADGALEVELGGADPGSGYDCFWVDGAATLDGTLDVRLLNGYRPSAGDLFVPLTFQSRQGDFAALNGLDLGDELSLLPFTDDTAYYLFVVAP